jgi:hypothetical protein
LSQIRDHPQDQAEVSDLELCALIDALVSEWPMLPSAIRKTIGSLINSCA